MNEMIAGWQRPLPEDLDAKFCDLGATLESIRSLAIHSYYSAADQTTPEPGTPERRQRDAEMALHDAAGALAARAMHQLDALEGACIAARRERGRAGAAAHPAAAQAAAGE